MTLWPQIQKNRDTVVNLVINLSLAQTKDTSMHAHYILPITGL